MAILRILMLYEDNDRAIASRLDRDLHTMGADVTLSTGSANSADAVAELSKALQRNEVVVLVFSPSTAQSLGIQQVFNAAMMRAHEHLMRPPIIVLARPCQIADLPPLWHVYHRYDAAQDYEKALRGLAHELGLVIPRSGFPSYPRLALAAGIASVLVIYTAISYAASSDNPDAYVLYLLVGSVHNDGTSASGILDIASNVFLTQPAYTAALVIMLFADAFTIRESAVRRHWAWLILAVLSFVGFVLVGVQTTGSYKGSQLAGLAHSILVSSLSLGLVPLLFALFGPVSVRTGRSGRGKSQTKPSD